MISFLDLPGEIRLIIYAYSLDPNEYVSGYRKIEDLLAAETDRTRGPMCTYARPHVERYTPSILLINRQITMEALHVLYRIPLNLYGTPNTYFTMRQMDITEFISEHLLQQIHHGVLRLDSASKNFVLPLLDIWCESNCLESLDVYRPNSTPMPRHHWYVVKSRLRTFSTLVPVVFHKVDDPLKADAAAIKSMR
ncbi:hypothetical protein N7523_003805 [Penicillium sp. IBT 18751x]|nr:hypothetical protein N7523_003805 [Penicillium sp. IBT 18751x]